MNHIRGHKGTIAAVLVAVLAAATLLAVPAGAATAGRSASAARATTTQGATQGPIAFGADTSGSTQSAVTKVEADLGHKLAYTRDFLLWDSPFPTSYENWLGSRGTVIMLSVKSRLLNGTAVPWASVAGAQPGSTLYRQLVSWADRVRDFAHPIYFTYNHEPEAATNNDLGSARDYIAAWRKVHDVFVAEGATNVKFLNIATSYAYIVPSTDRRYGWDWYPGDDYVDAIGADAYNWGFCQYPPHGTWWSLAQVISGFMQFGADHPTKPMFLPEFATVEDANTPGRKAAWIADAQALFKKPEYARFAGVAYYNHIQTGRDCVWPYSSSAGATTALRSMAQDAYYQGSAVLDTTSPPPTPTGVALAGSASTTANAPSETVRVPSNVVPGNGLVLIATSATPGALTAPAGWTATATTTSATMTSTVWSRVAASGDAGTSVTVGFGATAKGSVEVLAYSGTDPGAPVRSAQAATTDTSFTSLTAPSAAGAQTGDQALGYWAVRTSVDTTVTPPGDLTVDSRESGTGGGRIVSASADGALTASRTATVSPSTGHGLAWTVVLRPAS